MFSEMSQSSLRFEFTGGSLCELDLGVGSRADNAAAGEVVSSPDVASVTPNNANIESTPRAATVDIYCGDSDAILSILEDHTCHYNVKISSTLMCKHPEFSPPQREVVRLSLERLLE
jgi:hypothetical protein